VLKIKVMKSIKLKREIDSAYDCLPSIGHKFNASLVKKYLLDKSKILDIGCWSGQLLSALGSAKVDYYGLDVSEASGAIKLAQNRYKNAKFVIGSGIKLPFRDNFFDIVTIFDVVEHLPVNTEKRCFMEIKRVIKNNGILLLSTPADNIISIISDPAYFISGHRHYSRQNLDNFLKSSGFEVVNSYQIGGFHYIFYYLLQMFFKHLIRRPLPNAKLIKILEKKAKKSLSVNYRGLLAHYIIARSV